MAFSMGQINRSKVKHNTINNFDDIKACFACVKQIPILTPSIKYALTAYIKYRLKLRMNSNLTTTILSDMVQELLEKCCNENIQNIQIQHVEANEKEILYQIKKAIYYGATKHLYFEPTNNSTPSNIYRANVMPPVRIPLQIKVTLPWVKTYFKELE